MRYFTRTLLGGALMAFALTVLGYACYELLQIGTCASGNTPYDIARRCPGGTERFGLAIPVALMLMLLGAGIYWFRGRAPGSDKDPNQGWLVVWVWTGIFWSIAAASFLGVWGPDANPGQGAKFGGLFVGFLFLPMGAMGLLSLGSGSIARSLGRMAGGSGKGSGGSGGQSGFPGMTGVGKLIARMPGADPVTRIQSLQQLRDQGALSDAEFQKLKKKAIDD